MGEYIQQLWKANEAAPSKRARLSGAYQSYLPDPLSSVGTIDADLSLLAAQIERRILGIQGSVGEGLESLSRFLLRGEAVASSRIEGLVVGAKKLAIAQLRAESATGASRVNGHSTHDAVIRNITTLRTTVESLSGISQITSKDIVKLQAQLIEDTELRGIRYSQNWLGGSDYHPLTADYVPPAPKDLPPLWDDLLRYLNGATHGALIQAGLVHAQFETLHPFADGNGRIGRALIHLVLTRRGLTAGATLPISIVLQTKSEEYVSGLSAFRFEGPAGSVAHRQAVEAWLKIFVNACEVAVNRAEDFIRELEQLRQQWRIDHEIHYRRGHTRALRQDSGAYRLREQLANTPMLTVASAARELGCSLNAAEKALTELTEAGVLAPLSVSRGVRGWYQPDVFDLITDSERALASSRWDTGVSAPGRPVPIR